MITSVKKTLFTLAVATAFCALAVSCKKDDEQKKEEPKPAEYVEIAAKYDGTNVSTLKWYRQNLAISDSGRKAWKGNNTFFPVTVPGTSEKVVVGDFFQWAAYEGYCGSVDDPDIGLLVYTSFEHERCGDGSNSIVLKDGKKFNSGSVPYGSSSNGYTKYMEDGSTLERLDDVAKSLLGGTWRLPTAAELAAMLEATVQCCDEDDYGVYIFSPDANHPAGKTYDSIPSSLNKSDALLFFPAACYMENDFIYDNFYDAAAVWSSTSKINFANEYHASCLCLRLYDTRGIDMGLPPYFRAPRTPCFKIIPGVGAYS